MARNFGDGGSPEHGVQEVDLLASPELDPRPPRRIRHHRAPSDPHKRDPHNYPTARHRVSQPANPTQLLATGQVICARCADMHMSLLPEDRHYACGFCAPRTVPIQDTLSSRSARSMTRGMEMAPLMRDGRCVVDSCRRAQGHGQCTWQ
jgi:hypothetical protein